MSAPPLYDHDAYLTSLPLVLLKEEYVHDSYLCTNLNSLLEGSRYYVHCPGPQPVDKSVLRVSLDCIIGWDSLRFHVMQRKRSADTEEAVEKLDSEALFNKNITVSNLAESRTNKFSGIFLITVFVSISLGLALYAVIWILWNMDPGRDSVIYRQVSDPTIRMQQLN